MPLVTPSPRWSSKRRLPPSRHMPVAMQTAYCRWFPTWYLEGCQRRLGDRFTVYALDMLPLVFLTNPDDIRAVLTGDPRCLHPGPGAALLAPLIGDRSFMLLDEEDHIFGRRIITPAFHHSVVGRYAIDIADAVRREVQSWPLDSVVPLDGLIRTLTLRIILRAIFGNDLDTCSSLHERLIQMLSVTVSLVLQEPKIRHVPGWRGTWQAFARDRFAVDRALDEIVDHRSAAARRHDTDLLDMLLAARHPDGSPMTRDEIHDNLMSMILAGHETTTGELTWAFQLLAHHRHIQERLAAEIDADTEDDYLTATIYETMRRKPVFLFAIPRQVVRPIDIGGCTYRPPAHLVACTYLMHHDPALYRDPYEFRPERFLEESPEPRTWLPWGGGRKHCLGHHFALLEMKAILKEVLATRVVLPASRRIEHPRWRSAIVVPHAGGRVILRERGGGA